MKQNAKVLVVGSGAREHAIAWKLSQSAHEPVLYAAPGNPGMKDICELVNIQVADVDGLVGFAKENEIDLVVIGPEQPLSLGLVDKCFANGIRAFGPSANAAQLESSKAFAKELMERAQVPTASYRVFTDAPAAVDYVQSVGAPIVIKADGLAAGKGVTVATTVGEAVAAIEDIMVDAKFGTAGHRVVVESCLTGQEVSLMFFVDASGVKPMVSARDHKRVFDGDQGPNTGGMGAFAPVPSFDKANMATVVEERIVRPTLAELKERGIDYRGVLYVGLMMTKDGPSVIEFNARFGDPETEVVLPLLETDLLEILWAITEDKLAMTDVMWSTDAAVCVVLAAPGYPEAPKTGGSIVVDSELAAKGRRIQLFHAGTAFTGNDVVTSGGRVLVVSTRAGNVDAARAEAYAAAELVDFEGKHYRRDIALTQ